MARQIAIPVTDASQIGEARRAAARMSHLAKHEENETGRLAIIVTELATNLARYAKNGQIILSVDSTTPAGACEVLAIDSGPGMDTVRCLADGYSTGGTHGNGLGAIQRLASDFDIYSTAAGTVVLARVRPAQERGQPDFFRWACINLPAKGEEQCGDSFRVSTGNHARTLLMIADGLGHGPEAAAASSVARTVFDSDPTADPAAFMRASNTAMAGTRGAAVAAAQLDFQANVLHYAGVGNIAGTIIANSERRGLPSQNGIVGSIFPKLRTYDYPLPSSGLLVMHSDGLHARCALDAYPGLFFRHPALIAAVLFRDFYRGRDDVTVLVGAWRGGSS